MDQDTKHSVQKKVVLKINFDDISAIKLQLKRLQERNPRLQYGPIKIGHLGDDVILSFDVEEEFYGSILEKLEFTGAKSVIKTENTGSVAKNDQPGIALQVDSKDAPSQFKTSSNQNKNTLENFIAEGDYEKVIELSKNVKSGYEMMKKAKEKIDDAVTNAIKITYNRAVQNKVYLEESITKLTRISSDKRLKLLNKVDLMTAAGLRAVKLCENSFENVSDLILIANNNLLPNIVVIKAAVKFSEIIFSEPEKYAEDYKYAVKYLNTRWLLIAKDVVISKITLNEKLHLKNLIDYIDSAR